MLKLNEIYNMDCISGLKQLDDNSVNCCVTSPPYWGLRDYGVTGQLGLEETPEEYVLNMVEVFREVKRVLTDDGTLWLNLGDSYAGSGKGRNADGTHQEGGKQGTNKGTVIGELYKTKVHKGLKAKDLVGIPWMVAFALRADGWYLRSDIIWHKTNAMPESVKDRPTKSHEYIFLLTKNDKYFYDIDAIRERAVSKQGKGAIGRGKQAYAIASGMVKNPQQDHSGWHGDDGTRNKRTVWSIPTKPFKEAHFATFPPTLIEPCILAGCPKGGIVLDPFMGAATTAMVSIENSRNYVGFELNKKYIKIAEKRLEGLQIKLTS